MGASSWPGNLVILSVQGFFAGLGIIWQPRAPVPDKGGVYWDDTEAASQHRGLGDGGVHHTAGLGSRGRFGGHLRHRRAPNPALPADEALDWLAASVAIPVP